MKMMNKYEFLKKTFEEVSRKMKKEEVWRFISKSQIHKMMETLIEEIEAGENDEMDFECEFQDGIRVVCFFDYELMITQMERDDETEEEVIELGEESVMRDMMSQKDRDDIQEKMLEICGGNNEEVIIGTYEN